MTDLPTFNCPRWPGCGCPDGGHRDDCPQLAEFLNEVNKDTAARSSAATAANATAAPLATPPAGDPPAPAGAIHQREPLRLTTFERTKYREQSIAIKGPERSFNIELFDAALLFLALRGLDDNWTNRGQVLTEASAWAEQFVAQMNAGAGDPFEAFELDAELVGLAQLEIDNVIAPLAKEILGQIAARLARRKP